jgi:glycosyltransferase involved in cell wall biosynthesis
MNRKIVVWQAIVSPHMVYTFIELSKLVESNVYYIAYNEKNHSRLQDGWTQSLSNLNSNLIFLTKQEEIDHFIQDLNSSYLHFTNGINIDYWKIGYIDKCIYNSGGIWVAIFESINKFAFLGTLRRIKFQSIRFSRHKPNFAYCIGKGTADWFRKWNIVEMVFDGSYYIKPIDLIIDGDISSSKYNIGYFGQLISRKNIEGVILVLAEFKHFDFVFNIFGGGELNDYLKELVIREGLADHVVFHGLAQMDEVPRLISAMDFTILPSVFDGYGVAVLDSLLQGIPVICSNRCGAAILQDDEYVKVFDVTNSWDLRSVLLECFNNGRLTIVKRKMIRNKYEKYNAVHGAKEILKIIKIISSFNDNIR